MLHNVLNNIKNRAAIHKNHAFVKNTFLIRNVLNKLVNTGHLVSVELSNDYTLMTRMRFPYKVSTFKDLEMISTPGRRIYVKAKNIMSYVKDRRTVILSTNQGILTHREAIEKNVGGVLLFKI